MPSSTFLDLFVWFGLGHDSFEVCVKTLSKPSFSFKLINLTLLDQGNTDI